MPDYTIDYKARFGLKEYNITYDSTGYPHQDSISSYRKTYNIEEEFSLCQHLRGSGEGVGYYQWYYQTQSCISIPKGTKGDITVNYFLVEKFLVVYASLPDEEEGKFLDFVAYDTPPAKITKPADPVWEGHTFLGWYKDSHFYYKFDFDNGTFDTTKNFNLYAKWSS